MPPQGSSQAHQHRSNQNQTLQLCTLTYGLRVVLFSDGNDVAGRRPEPVAMRGEAVGRKAPLRAHTSTFGSRASARNRGDQEQNPAKRKRPTKQSRRTHFSGVGAAQLPTVYGFVYGFSALCPIRSAIAKNTKRKTTASLRPPRS